ncbi:LysM peptidoglycan-binding domain-containing protein [Bacillus sp. V3B]|uniref:LysM peptidoglycan-binding domain-containing protein n=1 Tax=Bacillus sp. V3B TaxID=2804915 RepID=UPI00210E1C5C|nr:LysM peptidoglycan-binding domain-containing protein [Bacillus sp. V3B]MCQ6273504.1 LysM peptidoglycan-binding domain-containing protein [Bacillus sp. V3B]
MSYGNQSHLRFTLEESVWFQKGQEVDELLSIALDPNISIQESDQYVTIKGSLELSGEYNREEMNLEEEVDYFTNPKIIQAVEVREEGIHLFSHHFPVEVTIPKNRIQELQEIDVFVETFDYAFPERSCLMLSADLMITGLYGEQQHELLEEQTDREEEEELEELEEMEEIPKLEPLFQEPVIPEVEVSERPSPFEKPLLAEEESTEFYKPFEVEARKEPQVEVQNKEAEGLEQEAHNLEDEVSQPEYVYQRQDVEPKVNVYEKEEEVVNREEEASKQEDLNEEQVSEQEGLNEEVIYKQEDIEQEDIMEDVIEAVREEVNEEIDEIADEEIVNLEDNESIKDIYPEITFSSKQNEEKRPTPVSEENIEEAVEDDRVLFGTLKKKVVDVVDAVDSLVDNESSSSSSSSSPEQQAKQKNKKWKNKQSLTLSEFFARKEEEEHTMLKMCIVQNGDNLDIISERYNVPVAQLQRVNEMELNQDIYEGQVLYIPIAQSQR